MTKPDPFRVRPAEAVSALLLVGTGLLAGLAFERLRSPEPGPAVARSLGADTTSNSLLLFVFQEGDCPASAILLRRLEGLQRSAPLRVVAVGIDVSPDLRPVLRDSVLSQFDFDVRFDLSREAGRLLAATGFRRTPTTVLLDPAGRVRSAHPPVAEPELQESVVGSLGEQARLVRGRAAPEPRREEAP